MSIIHQAGGERMPTEMYTILALAARYWFCGLMLLIVFRAWRITVVDNRRAKILRSWTPETGSVGELIVVIPGERKKRLHARIPREGVLGSGGGADVRIRSDAVQKKHAYMELREDGLLIRPLRGASLTVGGKETKEQVLLKDGESMKIGPNKLILVLFDAAGQPVKDAQAEEDDLFTVKPERAVRRPSAAPDEFFDEDELWPEEDEKNAKRRR